MKRRLAVVTAAALFTLTACASASSTSSAGGSSSAPPVRGGALTISLASEARGLDPFAASPQGAVDGNRLDAIYDVLLRLDSKTDKIEPGIATSLTTTDNLSWTLKLRSGVTFTDGTPFDAAAVEYTWEQHSVAANGSLESAALTGATFVVVDPLTLKIVLPTANSTFDKLVARAVPYIMSPTAFKKEGLSTFSQHPVGAGPFEVEQWVRDDHLTLRRNPAYWDAPLPNLDELTFTISNDETQRYNSFVAGESDLMLTQTSQTISRAQKAGDDVDLHELNGGDALMFNDATAPFDDVRAREAIAYGLSRTRLNAVVYDGTGTVSGDPFRRTSPYYVAGMATPDDDPAKAQQLLDELAADGRALSFTLLVPSTTQGRELGEYVQAALSSLKNIKVGIKTADPTAYLVALAYNHSYQLSFSTLRWDDPEPVLYNRLHSGRADNYDQYSNPAMDEALDADRTASTTAGHVAAITQAQKIMKADIPFWLYQQAEVGAIHTSQVAGVQFFNEGTMRTELLGRTGG